MHAAATWPRSPLALVLVGDGTSDPHNELGRNNTNHIPPHLALVDPWLGETACEPCVGQLDGDDPLDDALPDVAVGRLPVKTEAELVQLVGKLIGYDTADGAGDFAAFAELSTFLGSQPGSRSSACPLSRQWTRVQSAAASPMLAKRERGHWRRSIMV